jgi:hypothetical protein
MLWLQRLLWALPAIGALIWTVRRSGIFPAQLNDSELIRDSLIVGNTVPPCFQETVLTKIQRKIHHYSTKFSLLKEIIANHICVFDEGKVNAKVNSEERHSFADNNVCVFLGRSSRNTECAGQWSKRARRSCTPVSDGSLASGQ